MWERCIYWGEQVSPMCTVKSNSQQIWPSLWPTYPQSAMRDRDHAIEHLIVWFNVNFSTRRWGFHPVGLVQPFLSTQRGAMSYKSTFRADNQENPSHRTCPWGEACSVIFYLFYTIKHLVSSHSVFFSFNQKPSPVGHSHGMNEPGSPTETPTGNSL